MFILYYYNFIMENNKSVIWSEVHNDNGNVLFLKPTQYQKDQEKIWWTISNFLYKIDMLLNKMTKKSRNNDSRF